MPFSLFNPEPGFYDFTPAQPYQSSLTLEDLWRPSPRPVYPEAPTPYQGYGDLGDEAKKKLRREAILRIAAALGGDPGRLGTNLAGAALDLGAWKEDELAAARQRQERDYAIAGRQAEVEAERRNLDMEDEQRKRQAQGYLTAIRSIAEDDPDLASQAEAAALSGDEVGLRETMKEANRRRNARARGEDPNDPFADERAKARIKAEEERRAEEELRTLGLGRYYNEPVDLSEIFARSQAAARGSYSVWGGRGGGDANSLVRMVEGRPMEIVPGEEGYSMRPIPGAPPEAGRWQVIPANQDTGAPSYRLNVETGETRPLPPPPPTRGQVIYNIEQTLRRKLTIKERADAERDYSQGTKPRDIVARLRARKPVVAPEKAPTEGPAPKPPKTKSGPPPAAIRQRTGGQGQDAQEKAKRKLDGVRNPGLVKKIQEARAAGYSDAEIVTYLGIR